MASINQAEAKPEPFQAVSNESISWLQDIQAARVVLNIAELFRFHWAKMVDMGLDQPARAVVESFLEESGISAYRLTEELRELLAIQPNFAEAWLELGYSHFDRDDLAAAKACFDKSLALSPSIAVEAGRASCHASAALGKARALEAMGKTAAAADAFAAAHQVDHQGGLSHVAYGRLLLRLGRGREALAEFDAGMQSDVTAIPLPDLPRDFGILAERLKVRFSDPRARAISPQTPPERHQKWETPNSDVRSDGQSPGGYSKSIRLITVVWGESFLDLYLGVAVRSLFSSGNLTELTRHHDVKYSVYTNAAGAERLRLSTVFRRIEELVSTEIIVFSEHSVDTENPSSHWLIWRDAASLAKKNRETVFFIIPDMLFAAGTLVRWADLFAKGYRAVCTASPQVVAETVFGEVARLFPDDASAITLTTAEVQRLLLRHLHPLMIAMYRDSRRPSRHPDSVLREAPGAGLVLRVMASQPFCIDLNHFQVNNAFCPLDRLEDIAFDQPSTVCLEPLLKYPDLYYRPALPSEDRLSNMGSWIDYHLGPSDMLWSAQNSRFIGSDQYDEQSFRRAEVSLGAFVAQMRFTGSIYRIVDAMRQAGCSSAAQLVATAHFAGRLRRRWRGRGEITVFAPTNAAITALPLGELERLVSSGNEKALLEAILRHVFAGRLALNKGDGLARRSENGGIPGDAADPEPAAPLRGSVARIVAGPIDVDDCRIYIIDRPLSRLLTLQFKAVNIVRDKASILPNRWTTNPGRRMPPWKDAAVSPAAISPTPASSTVLTAWDNFLSAYIAEAGQEDATRAGGLNGHLSVARLLEFENPLHEGASGVLVSFGSLYHRLHLLAEVMTRYAEVVGLPSGDMPFQALLHKISPKTPPLRRARELYEAALLLDSRCAWAKFNLAGVMSLEGDVVSADSLYRSAAEEEPFLRPHAALRRAAISEAAGDWSAAADRFLEAADGLQTLGEWHQNAARCLRLCGRLDEALQHYFLALNWVRAPGAEFLVSRSLFRPAVESDYAAGSGLVSFRPDEAPRSLP